MNRRDVLRDLLRPHAGRLVLAVLLSGLAGVAAALLLAASFALLTWAAQQPPVLYLLVVIVAVRALALVRAGARYGERLAGHDVALRVVDATRRWVWRRLSRQPHRLAGRRDGDALQMVVADLDQVQQLLVAGLVPLGGAVVGSLAVVAAGAVASAGVAAILALGLGTAGGVLAWAAHRDGRGDGASLVDARAALTSALLDDLASAEELTALGATGRVAAALTSRAAEIGRAEARAGRRETIVGAVVGVVAVATTIAVAVAAGQADVDGRLVAASVGLALAGFELVAPVPIAARRAGEALAAVDRLARLGDGPPAPPPHAAGAGVLLQVDGVGVGPSARPRLTDVSLTVAPGARIAVVGPSGSGKTTLAHVLCGLQPPDAGAVATAGRVDVRDLVALVPQAPHLLAGTIRENLRVADAVADDLTLLAALARVGLDDWVAATPAGLDTVLGEAGHGLSAGQARRLATARALLADRRVLVLDEPTADLDPTTAAAVLRDLLAAAEDRTVVLVTHDPRAAAACDVVHTMADGRLASGVS